MNSTTNTMTCQRSSFAGKCDRKLYQSAVRLSDYRMLLTKPELVPQFPTGHCAKVALLLLRGALDNGAPEWLSSRADRT